MTSFSRRSIVPENLSPSLVSVASSVRRLSISAWMVWLCSAKRGGEARGVGEQGLQRAALSLKDLYQRSRQRVDILRIEAADNGFEPTEQQVEVQRRLRPFLGNLRPGRQWRAVGPSISSR